MVTLADIDQKVTEESDVETAAITLLNQISVDLKAALANNDPAALQAISDHIDANKAKMAAAIVANTPAENPPADTSGQPSA